MSVQLWCLLLNYDSAILSPESSAARCSSSSRYMSWTTDEEGREGGEMWTSNRSPVTTALLPSTHSSFYIIRGGGEGKDMRKGTKADTSPSTKLSMRIFDTKAPPIHPKLSHWHGLLPSFFSSLNIEKLIVWSKAGIHVEELKLTLLNPWSQTIDPTGSEPSAIESSFNCNLFFQQWVKVHCPRMRIERHCVVLSWESRQCSFF